MVHGLSVDRAIVKALGLVILFCVSLGPGMKHIGVTKLQ